MENGQNKHELLEAWFPVKERKHNTIAEKIPRITEGEVWWVAVSENVGVEINGKSEYFSRPVLVFKKLSHLGFMSIPLSTQEHGGSWYVNFRFQGKEVYAALSQAKTFSTARLYTRLGQVAEDDMEKVRSGFRNLYLGE
ncbi:type II toxin-antitoxin system PemK/MazF family toxin [Candidatus Saccharibacteria bacterium]|nr:type II toxin-antitoxin system PemK/MazF family toxin [Candidatus Saccharibacteria bacterium]